MSSARPGTSLASALGSGKTVHALTTLILSAWLFGPVFCVGLVAAQGSVETQKGPPPAPAPLAPQSAPPPAGSADRPVIEPAPGKPALAPQPGAVDEHGQPVPGTKRILGRRPAVLIGVSGVVVLILAAGAVRRRSRVDQGSTR